MMRWIAVAAVLAGGIAMSQQKPPTGYDDTPMLPDGKWRVHDGKRPQPRVVTPGGTPGAPPSDAIVLFDGKDLTKWRNAKGEPAGWKVENGYMEVPLKGSPGSGDVWTREEFGDCQLHIEWRTPDPPKGDSQQRGNSGVFFFGQYELQVLDSHQNVTYPDGQAASLYGQTPPLVNASRKPGEWQAFDVIFTAPRFKDQKVESPAVITVLHNGVVVHHHQAYIGASFHKKVGTYTPHGPKGAIKLQDHGDPMRFRNIWLRPLQGYDEP